jgi:3'-phosphoadenosine 5'-phosphosulfate sulfotransferase (PAPS reductase)/FAD synthetase
MTPDHARAYAATRQHQAAVLAAQRIIDAAYDRTPHWYVSVSGGKDSTVVLDLVRQIVPDAPAVAFVQKWMLPETIAYLRSVSDLAPVAARDVGDLEYTDGRWRDETEARAVWPAVTWLPWTDAAADHRYGRREDGAFLGLRADESRGRRMNMRTRGVLYHNQTADQLVCTPIVRWTVADVWAYVLSRNIPYNAAYDVLERLGVPRQRQRIAEFSIERVVQFGTLAILKRGWPNVWNAYAEEHPDARSYA